MPATLHFAVGSDIGRRRSMNQDSGCASARLLAVADGMGGHAHGEVASKLAITALAELDTSLPDGPLDDINLVTALHGAVSQAGAQLTKAAADNPELHGAGTTVVAMLIDGTRAGVVHIGDSRAYRLRADELIQLTRDHTLVQALVDEGRITPEEALVHPRRSVLIRTMQASGTDDPDLLDLALEFGDRYLLCSDGVTAVLTRDGLHHVLSTVADPSDAVARLIELANEGGGPDNITCIVADVVEEPAPAVHRPIIVGSAAETVSPDPASPPPAAHQPG